MHRGWGESALGYLQSSKAIINGENLAMGLRLVIELLGIVGTYYTVLVFEILCWSYLFD